MCVIILLYKGKVNARKLIKFLRRLLLFLLHLNRLLTFGDLFIWMVVEKLLCPFKCFKSDVEQRMNLLLCKNQNISENDNILKKQHLRLHSLAHQAPVAR